MENSGKSHSNGYFALPWFATRVFFVKIGNCVIDNSTPECLTLNHVPLSPDTILEVNGTRCSMDSEGISCILRRDRVDRKSEEATLVSTDSIRGSKCSIKRSLLYPGFSNKNTK
ncbi:Erythronate-4-phosphate dehydrogenase family protein [Striga hermonthica]|uniref:Erythronate-4-phosphate dehydrogenase family protein n=1 Tax=Striga hermonthica TaxID=68872 RepID=A0A9N7R5Q6_STRHE|nr:Erythronate-4-phosphate dehydrogenase family protein [Striga hermonthica]